MIKPAACAQPAGVKTQRPRSRWGRKILVLILIVCSLYWAWLKINNPQTFPIRSVKIIGTVNHLSRQQLCHTIESYLTHGMLFLDARELESTLAQLPWVEKASLSRKWPDELVIYITEQTPIARWNTTRLLNAQGNVFLPDNSPVSGNLPLLYGPDNLQNIVWSGYQTMNNLLQPAGLKIIAVSVSSRHAWDIYLNNGIHLILGREQVLNRLKRFIKAYPEISSRANNIQYVDLRYNDGFAIKWKNVL